MDNNDLDKTHKAYLDLYNKTGEVLTQKGTRTWSMIAGIVVIFLAQIRQLNGNRDNYTTMEIVLISTGAGIILAGLLFSSLEYKWYTRSKVKEKELLNVKYKAEINYNLRIYELFLREKSLENVKKQDQQAEST